MWGTAELTLSTSKALVSPEQRTRGGAGGVPGEMRGVADTQVCFSLKLILNCDH